MNKDLVVIGKIRKSFGLKGEVYVEPLTFSVERFRKIEKVFIGLDPSRVFESSIEFVKFNKDKLILKFRSLNSISEIETYCNNYIFVETSDTIKLPKGKYFIYELIGLSVFDQSGIALGLIKDVWLLPANNVYVVNYNGKEVLIPAIDEVVKKIDLKMKKMIINVIDGLFEV